MLKKVLSLMFVAVVAMSVVSLSSCAKKEESKTGTQEKTLRVGMVTDVGGVNDQSFNQSAWEGLSRAKAELKIKASYMESKQDADYQSNLDALYDAGNDLIWGIGFKMGDKVKAVAKQNPDQKYAIIDYSYGEETPKNLCGVLFKAEEASFLVGYIAAKMSKTNKVGFVGGMDFAVIHGFHYGYLAGAKYGNKDIEVLQQYAESFSDAAKGKAIANQMYKKGADVIFHAAGGVGDGVIESAKEQNKFVIGVDRDQNYLAPENVITSAMKRVDNAMFNIVKDLDKDVFPAGKTVSFGLKEGGVDIAPTSSKLVPKEILDQVEVIKQLIIKGEIIVPNDKKSYDKLAASAK